VNFRRPAGVAKGEPIAIHARGLWGFNGARSSPGLRYMTSPGAVRRTRGCRRRSPLERAQKIEEVLGVIRAEIVEQVDYGVRLRRSVLRVPGAGVQLDGAHEIMRSPIV
jgi:hypothetical protein